MTRIAMHKHAELDALLRLGADPSTAFVGCVDRSLTRPLEEFLLRGGKGLRAKVVEAGFRLGAPAREFGAAEQACCAALAECVEAIHAGSLIVDDVQDGAQVRRGAPTFHRTHGVAVAINAGNLLYFWGLNRIAAAGLPPEAELTCSRRLNQELLRAHYGQAVDVGTPIDEIRREDVFPLCLASIRLKSGVLMALALTLGATAAGASEDQLERLDAFGHLLGMGLQMFDDLNNVAPLSTSDPNHAKRFEDLLLRRPSWVWAHAASTCSDREYLDFIRAVHALPDESLLKVWMRTHDFAERASAAALEFVADAFAGFELALSSAGLDGSALRVLRDVAGRFGCVVSR